MRQFLPFSFFVQFELQKLPTSPEWGGCWRSLYSLSILFAASLAVLCVYLLFHVQELTIKLRIMIDLWHVELFTQTCIGVLFDLHPFFFSPSRDLESESIHSL